MSLPAGLHNDLRKWIKLDVERRRLREQQKSVNSAMSDVVEEIEKVVDDIATAFGNDFGAKYYAPDKNVLVKVERVQGVSNVTMERIRIEE